MNDTMTKGDVLDILADDSYLEGQEVAIVANVKTTQVAGLNWTKLTDIPIQSSHLVDSEDGQPIATLHIAESGDLVIHDQNTGRMFLVKMTNLVGAVVHAIQFMDTHARAAHVTRIYTERFHPDQVMITEAMKMIEIGELYPAIDKYGQNAIVTSLAFGKSLIDGIGVPDDPEPED